MAARLDIPDRLAKAKTKLEWLKSKNYLQSLQGTIGADPMRACRAEVALHKAA
jgi:hypothetical protein